MTNAILAPIPKEHIECAYQTMLDKDFVCFGSDNVEFFMDETLTAGTEVYIYVSHSNSEIGYRAEYHGMTGNASEMKKLEEHRPATTKGDSSWLCFWMINRIQKLERPMHISEFQSVRSNRNLKPIYIPRTAMLVKS
jgi:hypothetical protein